MNESPVCFSHTMQFFPASHCGPLAPGGLDELSSQAAPHGASFAAPGPSDNPPHSEGFAAVGAKLSRDLISSPADAARPYLYQGCGVLNSLAEHFHGVSVRLFLNNIQSSIDHTLGC